MLLLAALQLCGCGEEGAPTPTRRIILLPDTQCYTRYAPEILEAQTDWIRSGWERLNIVHVAHLGDITDTGSPEEWSHARSAFAPLFGLVPLTLVSGNHDLGDNGSANSRASRFDATFAPTELLVDATFDGSAQNSVTLVGSDLLVLGLEFAPRDEVVEWANGVLDAYAARTAILVTHAFLGPDGRRYDRRQPTPQAFSPYEYGVSQAGGVHDGEELWQALISQHENVALVVSGHVPRGFETLISEGAGGRDVVQLLVDYQRGTACDPTGNDGDGFLIMLELPEADAGETTQTARVRAYSPFLGRFRRDHQVSFPFTTRGSATPL